MEKSNIKALIELVIAILVGFACWEILMIRRDMIEISAVSDRVIKRDSAREALENNLEFLKRDNDSLYRLMIRYDSSLSKSVQTIEQLTQPKVTTKTVNEALLWIKEYNDTLQ